MIGIPVGVRYMLLSALSFAFMGACVKAASYRGIPVLEIVAARALISACISYIDIKRKRISPWGHNKTLLTARGMIGTLALMCVFYSVINFYFPFIALPVSCILLGDEFIMPTGLTWLLLLLVGLFTQVAQYGLTKAMQTEDASKATAYSYVQVS